MRDIVEVFGVGGDLLEQGPGLFPEGEVLLLLVFATARLDQVVLAPDALDRSMIQRQVPFALQASCAEGGQLAAQLNDALDEFAGDLVGTGVRGAGEILQPFQPSLLPPPKPLAHGGHGGGKVPSRLFNSVLRRVGDQLEAKVKSVLHLANLIEVGDGSAHGPLILAARWLPWFPPPPRQPAQFSSPHSSTSASQGGYDVPGLFQGRPKFETWNRVC